MELTEPLARAGIGVWNCTRGSRLKVFPEWDLSAAVRVESLAIRRAGCMIRSRREGSGAEWRG